MIINGVESEQVNLADRGFNFGDGHFTTMKVVKGEVQLFDLHLARLKHACQMLFIDFKHWTDLVLHIHAQALTLDSGVLKLVITRGIGGKGYSPEGCSEASWFLQARDIPAFYDTWQQTGIALTVCRYQQTVNPVLSGLKTLNRLDQVMIKQELLGCDELDGIVCSTEGYVIETSMANIFWVKDNVIYTPSMQRSGVEGVMRKRVMDLVVSLNLSVEVGDYTIDKIISADEIFITNALMDIVPVNMLCAADIAVNQVYQRFTSRDSITAILQSALSH